MRPMTQKRLYTIIASVILLAGLIYGLAATSIGKEAKNTSAWAVRCDKDDKGDETYCEMFSSFSIKETGVRLVEFAVGYPPHAKGAVRGVITLPLGMMLEPGGSFQVEGKGNVYSFTMRQCSVKGCYAFIDMNKEVLKQFKSGEKVTLAFVLGEKKVGLGIPLTGFSNMFKTLK